jgi:predicted nucleic acid-binding protein
MSYTVVLDACVLVPMPLCDTLLRLAEEPTVYRPRWSEQILVEVGNALEKKLKRTALQRRRRLHAMREAFPDAEVEVQAELANSISCIPDPNDRHVVAAAICSRADALVTFNMRHFPPECIQRYGVVCQTPDQFLVQQFHLNPELVLEKLDLQAAALGQERAFITQRLQKMAPSFAGLVDRGIATGEEGR